MPVTFDQLVEHVRSSLRADDRFQPDYVARVGDQLLGAIVRSTLKGLDMHVNSNTGLLPDPNSLPCVDCGHVYAEGERRHEYDHHLGYAAKHQLDVQAVCTTCHRKRERDRG